MRKLLVMGATRGIGLETVKAALAAGWAVRATARAPAWPGPQHEALEYVAGDALDTAHVSAALEGVEAVVQSLGVAITLDSVRRGTTLFSRATNALLAAMAAHGPRRLVVVTGFGAGDSREAMSGLEKLGHGAVLGRIYADKHVQEAAVRESGLDWTLVRPGILTNWSATGTCDVLMTPDTWRNGLISRADVASFLVRCVDEPEMIGAAPVIVR